MASSSQWRSELARQLAPAYSVNPHVAAVMIGGSVSRGYSDAYSDIELGVFWSRPPADSERIAAAERVKGSGPILDAYDVAKDEWIDCYEVKNVKIDLVHRTVAGTEHIISDVIENFDGTAYKQILIAAVREGIPLTGQGNFARWRIMTDRYPDGLVHAVAAANLALKPWWSVEVLAERGSFLLVHHALCTAGERILTALAGINRRYYSGIKWLPQLMMGFSIAPPSLDARLSGCFSGVLASRVKQMASLVEETYDLAEAHVPGLDVGRLREIFRQRRNPVA